jgi:DNA-binding CsgD family transcriptional regulator
MNALQLFRTGKDYIEISQIMRISVPDVERQIHRLRNEEKGDTTHDDYMEQYRSRDRKFRDKWRAYQREARA